MERILNYLTAQKKEGPAYCVAKAMAAFKTLTDVEKSKACLLPP